MTIRTAERYLLLERGKETARRVLKEEQKNHLYLSDDEYRRVLQSLIRLKNSLIAQGRYTDGVDDVLCKVISAKKRKLKIKYI